MVYVVCIVAGCKQEGHLWWLQPARQVYVLIWPGVPAGAAHTGVCVQRCRSPVKAVPVCDRLLLWPLVLSCAKQGAADCSGWPNHKRDQGGQSRHKAGDLVICTCTGPASSVSCNKQQMWRCTVEAVVSAQYWNNEHHVLQIEQLHQQVVEQVKTLYHRHRHLHGWQDRELEIV